MIRGHMLLSRRIFATTQCSTSCDSSHLASCQGHQLSVLVWHLLKQVENELIIIEQRRELNNEFTALRFSSPDIKCVN